MEKLYRVLKIDQLSRLRDGGGIEKYYRIQFKTKGGVVDTVDIDEESYTEENVARVLTEMATKHDKILKL